MNRRNFLAYLSLAPVITTDLIAGDSNDFFLTTKEYELIQSINSRLKRLKRHIGYAHFNLVSFEKALFYARNYLSVGAFTRKEITFIERLFYEDPYVYGFYGHKTCSTINHKIATKDVQKIPKTGHYLFKGKSEKDYYNIVNDVGDTLILTSGVRNVVKQLSLYINKIYNTRGNMTKATIQIAPPAYSYHTISDFDVGKIGWGHKNFTADFATTREFSKMTKLEYIGMRYTKNNKDGVRFEPWHVEVI